VKSSKLIDKMFSWTGTGGTGTALSYHSHLAAVASLVETIASVLPHLVAFDEP